MALGAGAPVVQLSVGLSAALDDGGCGSCGGDDATLGDGVYLGTLMGSQRIGAALSPWISARRKNFNQLRLNI